MSVDKTPCNTVFFLNFFKDLGLNFFQISAIAIKLETSLKTYDDNKPDTTLNKIADDFYKCIQPYLDASAIITSEEIGFLIIYFCILTAITVIITAIIFLTLKSYNTNITIGFIIGVCLSYIIIGCLLVKNSFNIISNSLFNTENKIKECISKTLNDLDNFIIEEESSIDKALCAY